MNVQNSAITQSKPSGPAEITTRSRILNLCAKENVKTTPSTDVYVSIKECIMNNELPLNHQLNIKELGDRFGISATPVREALIRLSVEDFIVAIPNRGFFTKIFRLDALTDRFEIASSILGFCIDRGLKRGNATPSEVMRLLERADGSPDIATMDPASASSFIGDVSNAASSISGNTCAIDLIRAFNNHVHYIRSVDFEDPSTAGSSIETALGILRGLRCRDAERSIHHVDALMSGALARLPLIVREVNFRASLNSARIS